MRRLCCYVNSNESTRIYTEIFLIRKICCKIETANWYRLPWTLTAVPLNENLHKRAHLMYSNCITRLFLRLTHADLFLWTCDAAVTVFVSIVTLHTNSVEVHKAHVGECRPLGICHSWVMLGSGVRVQGVAVTESVSQSTFPGAK